MGQVAISWSFYPFPALLESRLVPFGLDMLFRSEVRRGGEWRREEGKEEEEEKKEGGVFKGMVGKEAKHFPIPYCLGGRGWCLTVGRNGQEGVGICAPASSSRNNDFFRRFDTHELRSFPAELGHIKRGDDMYGMGLID